MMKRIACTPALLLPALLAGQPVIVDKIAAVVGDEIILQSDVEIQYQQMLAAGGADTGARCMILEEFILNKAMLHKASVDSVEVAEDEVDEELESRIRHFISMIGSREKLEEYYKKSILEIKEEFRDEIADYLRMKEMQNRIVKNVRISPAEVKTFYKQIPEDSLPYYNAEVEIGQIVAYPKVSQEQKDYAIEKTEGIRKRVLAGEDFETLAAIFSEDNSAEDGGDLGFFGRGEMVPEFEAAAFSMKEGEVSKVIKTKFGYHIVKVMERRGEKVRASHILVKPKVTSSDLDAARAHLQEALDKLRSGAIAFEDAVNKYSEDESSRGSGGMIINQATATASFEMNQLPSDIYFVISGMKPGEYSQVTIFEDPTGGKGYKIIFLKSETNPHKANLREDYNRIQAVALAQKQQDAMREWLSNELKTTYFHVEDEYRGCPSIVELLTHKPQ